MQSSCFIIGGGPGMGLGLARRFARGGYRVGLITRQQQTINELTDALRADGYGLAGLTANIADFEGLKAAIDGLTQSLGPPQVLLYNAAGYGSGNGLEQDPEALMTDLRVSIGGFLLAVQQVVPAMLGQGSGTILATGGAIAYTPSFEYLSMGVGKTGLDYVVRSLAPTLARQGIHAGIVTIRGGVGSSPHFAPDSIAETFWQLHQEAPFAFTTEITYQ